MPNPLRDWAPATVTVEGVWQVGSYLNMSPVVRIQGTVQREDGTPPYGAVFDEVDPQNPVDMAIDWIRTGQLGPPPREI